MKNTKCIALAAIISLAGIGCASNSSRDMARTKNFDRQAVGVGDQLSAENIKEMERVLNSQGYNPGPIDGTVNAQTEEALRKFQQFNKLKVTGKIDRPTAAALEKAGANFGGSLGTLRDDASHERRGNK